MPSPYPKRSGRRQGTGLVEIVGELVIWTVNYGRISISPGDVHRISVAVWIGRSRETGVLPCWPAFPVHAWMSWQLRLTLHSARSSQNWLTEAGNLKGRSNNGSFQFNDMPFFRRVSRIIFMLRCAVTSQVVGCR